MSGLKEGTRGGKSVRRKSANGLRCWPPRPNRISGATGNAEACEMTFDFDLKRPFAAIVVGRAGIDLYPVPDGTETESAEQFAAEIGGSAGNIAVALSRQGYRAALLGALSADPIGRFGRIHLARFEGDTSRCRTVCGDYRTSLAICETRHED